MLNKPRLFILVCGLAALVGATRAHATGVPIGGFLPLVGIGLTDEFDDDLNTFPTAMNGVGGTLLGAGGVPRYDVALLDTGAAVSLLTRQAFADFGMIGTSQSDPDDYRGTETIAIGGATGTLLADINDPHGLYASGLQHRTATAPLAMNNALLRGQTNTSTITLPAESELPNVVGLSFASQYATYIRSDQPQIFSLGGKTVRTPAISFLPLGSGGQGITRRAPLSLNPGSSFQQPPSWLYHIPLDLDEPQEDPSLPTIIQGGLFLNVNLANSGSTLNNSSFFFDTGADVSVLSELTALQLGIDVVLDAPDFTVAVVGSGGAKQDVPGYFLDQFTIQAIGGSVVANNVPVIVLDVADPSNPANIVPGIVGTNLLAGRNVVIDPNPALGGGGASPSLYISDPVTTERIWATSAASAPWQSSGSWSAGAPPTSLGIATLKTASAGHQEAVLSVRVEVWEAELIGSGGRSMKVRVQNQGELVTFGGINIRGFGIIQLEGGLLDAQYVEILGGTLTGNGSIFTGSGPVAGQVENRSGTVAPGLGVGTLSIAGRFANAQDGALNIELGGTTAGTQYDQLIIDGPATLDGKLNVAIVNLGGGAFVPSLGNVFSIIAATEVGGEFSTVNLPTLTADKMWQLTYDATAVLLKVTIPGDFDGDFTVDGADLDVWRENSGTRYNGSDFLAWQRNLGMTLAPPGDFDGDFSVDAADLAVWRAGFGSQYNGSDFLNWQRNLGVGPGGVTAVPEPGALTLWAIALGGIAFWRRR